MSIRALHIASFNGNIGDMANHIGFYETLKYALNKEIEYEQLEMRKFYRNWRECSFDDKFVEYANTFDMVIFGGGSFMRLEWDDSENGTTIDISIENLKKIKSKIIFNGLGCHKTQGTNSAIIKKFKTFVDYCVSADNILFTVRNEGSKNNIVELLGTEYQDKIIEVPDGGFYTHIPTYPHNEYIEGEKYIAINVAGNHAITKDEAFMKSLGKMLESILIEREYIRIVFMPHIMKDYEAIVALYKYIADNLVRTRISCAPYLNGERTDGLYLFDLYRNAAVTLGMRFHSNVCPIGLNKPTIGFGTDKAINDMYDNVKLSRRYINFERQSMEDLKNILIEAIDNPDVFLKENQVSKEYLQTKREEQIKLLADFMKMPD